MLNDNDQEIQKKSKSRILDIPSYLRCFVKTFLRTLFLENIIYSK